MFEENLRKYRQLKGLTQNELAEEISKRSEKIFVGNNVRSWESGTNPKIDTIIVIANILNIPIQYLFNDSEDCITKMTKTEIRKNPDRYKKEFRDPDEIRGVQKIPLYSQTLDNDIGFIHYKDMITSIYIDSFHSIKKAHRNKEIKALQVLGDSMSPYANDLDTVIFVSVEKDARLSDGKFVISKNGNLLIRNLTFKINGNIVIATENKAYEKEELETQEDKDALKIIGSVVSRILKS